MADPMPHLQLAEGLASRDPGENLAKTAIQSVQQLLDDRNNLRQQLATTQDEIYALKAANADLRRLVAEIHKYYLGTTAKFVAHLKEIETTLHNTEACKQNIPGDETVASLARRFSPRREIGPMPTA